MKKIFFLAAAAIALAACDKNDDNPAVSYETVHITASIGESALSRAVDTTWTAGDRIGITLAAGDKKPHINMEYTTDGSGKFTGENPIYFYKPMTLTAYYPFAGEEGTSPRTIEANTGANNQASATQPSIDFLWDEQNTVHTAANKPEIHFCFAHKMSKLTLVFKAGDGVDVSKISAYEIGGLALDGTFNTETGECAAKADADSPLRIDLTGVTVENGKALDPLILFPQNPGSDQVTLRIESDELDGLDNPDLIQQYSCKLPFIDGELKPGNNYVYTITVSKTKVSVDRSSIAEWVPNALEAGASSAD